MMMMCFWLLLWNSYCSELVNIIVQNRIKSAYLLIRSFSYREG